MRGDSAFDDGGDRAYANDEAAADFDESQEIVALEPGLRVVHAVYGAGTVTRVVGQGMQMKATVDFDKSGERILLLEYAGLQVIPGDPGW